MTSQTHRYGGYTVKTRTFDRNLSRLFLRARLSDVWCRYHTRAYGNGYVNYVERVIKPRCWRDHTRPDYWR